MTLVWSEILIRLFLASLFGALIGLERERKDWAAGMRTHMMVCVGSCLIMMVSAFGFSDVLGTPHVELDPSRVAAQVISGIGFIGAGTILFIKQGTIRGLTTASGLWTVAAIGLATGGGMYFAAGATTFIALIILFVLAPIEQIYAKRFKQRTLKIIADAKTDSTELLHHLLNNKDLEIRNFNFERENDDLVFTLQLDNISESGVVEIINELKNHKIVKDIAWTK
ncbi:MgtC/SapB family protein [Pedobacter arcticus]|uniref:MgtC/SapB family protein n=1 Tax=Pedobacter arcticus TaxID=752140 RepID=UPI00036ECE44|nr:MgtC/SapB family protein [Pedobacter arcticus]